MKVLAQSLKCRRRGSVLLPTLFVLVVVVLLLSALLPLTVSGYALARADRDRAAALAAAEAGLNWEIARINTHRWDRNDSGSAVVDNAGRATLDLWPNETSAPPASACTRTLIANAAGQWTQRFIVGTSVDPFRVSGGSFAIVAEGQVRAADGHIVRRRVKCGGAGLFSLFDSAAVFALSPDASAWTMGGSCTVTGGSGTNGPLAGNGNPSITVGPLTLWGASASVSGVATTGIMVVNRPALFTTDTADQAANLLLTGNATGAGVTGWRPWGYNAGGSAIGPYDKFGHTVNSQAEIVTSSGVFVRAVKANEFLDGGVGPGGSKAAGGSVGQAVLDGHLWAGSSYRLRLKPGVYYFAQIKLNNNDNVEIANDWYQANGVMPLWDADHNAINGPATVEDYNSDANRITLFVDAVTVAGSNPYPDSTIGSGMFTALQGDKSTGNALRYRRPGNFRIYAKNTGSFTVKGSNNSSMEFNCNLLHFNQDGAGNYYGSITLDSGCHLYGGLFGWTVDVSGSSNVQQHGSGVFSSGDPVVVVPTGGTGSGAGGGIGGGYGGWLWQEIGVS